MQILLRLFYSFIILTYLCLFELSAQTHTGHIEHTVQAKETVYGISRMYGSTVEQVYAINPWARQGIKVGDKLIILIAAQDSVLALPSVSAVSKPLFMDATVSLKPIWERPVLRVLLVLPFSKSTRYLEFYQGFLMALAELKKDGISIDLTALDYRNDDELRERTLPLGNSSFDYVIGGVSDEQCRFIAKELRATYYIVPFADNLPEDLRYRHIIQFNNRQTHLVERVISWFVEQYRGKSIVFISRAQDREELFTKELKRILSHRGIPYRQLAPRGDVLAGLSAEEVLVPVNSSKSLAESCLKSLPDGRVYKLFGYPQWQSYGDEFLQLAGTKGASFYTSFYFDKLATESKLFLAQFNAWFDKKALDSYPKYSVLGYDLARYFLRAYAAYGAKFVAYGAQIPSDGLQSDIELEARADDAGYINNRFYIISLREGGGAVKRAY